jgi:hypothetical protein
MNIIGLALIPHMFIKASKYIIIVIRDCNTGISLFFETEIPVLKIRRY